MLKISSLYRQLNSSFLKGFTLLIPGFIWWLASFPARMSNDTFTTLLGLKDGHLNEQHGILNAIFMYIFSIGCRWIWPVSLTQIILLTCGLYSLAKQILPKRFQGIAVVVIMATPYGGAIGTTLWADTLDSIVLLFFLSRLMILSKSPPSFLANRRNIAIAILLGSLTGLIRHETPFVLLGFSFIFAVFFLKRKFLLTIIIDFVLIGSALLGVFFNWSLSNLPNVQLAPKSSMILPELRDLVVYAQEAPNDQSLHNFVSTYSGPLNMEASKYCGNLNPFITSTDFSYDLTKLESYDVYSHWAAFIMSKPVSFLSLHYCGAKAFLPFPISLNPTYVYWVHPGIDSNSLGLVSKPLLPNFAHISNVFSDLERVLGRTILWPGFLATSASILYFFRKRFLQHDIEVKLMLFFVYSNIFVLFVGTPAQDFRYGEMESILSLLVILRIICMNFLPRKTSKSKNWTQ